MITSSSPLRESIPGLTQLDPSNRIRRSSIFIPRMKMED